VFREMTIDVTGNFLSWLGGIYDNPVHDRSSFVLAALLSLSIIQINIGN
jgi:hypothetical protein